MHEVSLVAELVDAAVERADGRPITLVRVRRASTVPEDVLRFAWDLLAHDGPLATAELVDEPWDVALACPCGWAGTLEHDDVVGPGQAICPGCAELRAIERTAELELVEVRVGVLSPA